MALDHEQTSADLETNTNKDTVLNEKGDSGSGSNLDAERASKSKWGKYGNSDSSVGERIGPVLGHLGAYDFGSDDNLSDILGKQLEMEAGDAIQYRTCSWQKVS
jgi:hypothetical protein